MKDRLKIPKDYKSLLCLRETEKAIKLVKDFFQDNLSEKLNLQRVSAPLFLPQESGLNDNLTGIEKPVTFEIEDIETNNKQEIVHSLAKWKRMALKRYGFLPGEGLYTDMNAIRTFERLDNTHSVYVDQWDWEKIILQKDRTMDYLKKTVEDIYLVFLALEGFIHIYYPDIKPILPPEIFFITSQELEDLYPDLSPKEREDAICKKHGAVFISQIGKVLKSGEKHDGRAPDYDDWELNGDIIFWYPLLECAIELSSMGIRVDPKSLRHQLEHENCMDRADLPFHKALLNNEYPLTIGGGIGQSRICMFFLRKTHIGEVQASTWYDGFLDYCKEHGIIIL